MRSPAVRRLANLGLLVLTLTLLAPVAEGLVRWVFADITTTGDYGSWFASRWQREKRGPLNSHHRREREFRRDKSPGVYRIIASGDSVTFGQGIPVEARFSEELGRALGSGFEVLNFGQPGAELIHHAKTLRSLAPAHPDFLLLQWFPNDFEGEHEEKRARPHPANLGGRWHSWLHSHSALYYLANTAWGEWQRRCGTVGGYAQYMRDRFADPNSPDSLRAMTALDFIVSHVRDAGVGIGLVLFPKLSPGVGTGSYAFNYLHERVLGYCQQAQMVCLDLRSTYAPWADRVDQLHVNRFDAHPNALANTLAAKAILATFGPRWRADHRPDAP
ncbi:MAG: hypothetical protein LJE84_02225 [Gammaproteobacteria bacterium]|nr:hypothetical protein [Gammaproteobacteria bacterium]